MEDLTESKEQFQKEQDQLLQTILNYRFFYPWQHLSLEAEDMTLRQDANLELYFTANCNQKCEYCYLQKHKHQLYPPEYDKPELILNNLRKICDWIMVNNFHIPCLDLYSGEIWQIQLGWDILEIIYQYMLKGMQVDWILTTTNGSFVSDPKALQMIQHYIDLFRGLGHDIVFSISVDGKIIDEQSRPKNAGAGDYSDEFYDLIGTFARHNNYLFHPMVAPHNVKYWKENYEWWKQFLAHYDYEPSAIMTLEVRDADWTDENIKDYNDFMRVLMDEYFYGECKGDPEIFAEEMFRMRMRSNIQPIGGYVPWSCTPVDSFAGCTVSTTMFIRVGDLAICPCHRQAYKEYLYGYLTEEDGRITGVRAVNPNLAIKILMSHLQTTTPLCDKCYANHLCLHGCYGSQIESLHDPCFPIKNICKFFRAKTANILKYWREHGVIDVLKNKFSLNEPHGEEVMEVLRINEIAEGGVDELGII